jgi:SpoVK/Ycf46/Vps4 family AAA+-type ATPase
MAASVLAKHWDVPLFHLDISTSLNRFLGESESRIARNLNVIEQNAPCVWLLDEVEKLFGSDGGSEGTAQRILSQILWWLQSHQARVLSVMTTNKFKALPAELYRPGRVDRVLKFEKLGLTAGRNYAYRVYQAVLTEEPPVKRAKMMREMLDTMDKPTFSHAEVRAFVYDLIKRQGWAKESK